MARALFSIAPVLVGAAMLAAGCTNSGSPPAPVAKNTGAAAPKPDGEHDHKPSAHGGIVVAIGNDDHHVEAVFEKGGILRLYTLGANETAIFEVDAEPLTGFARILGQTESESFVLLPKPQPGDGAGKTSLFVGQLPKDAVGKKLVVSIPTIRNGKGRLRVAFQSAADTDDREIPTKVVDAEERKLYLSPGGKYTESDIEANGRKVASDTFAGLKAEHDLKPRAGDAICPITLTKANPKFSWVIGGRSYAFCCPPCVDEFVHLAKEKPNEIELPEFYRQK